MALGLLLGTAPAMAATFHVGPATCSSDTATCGADGDARCCTLLAGIIRANNAAGTDTILLDANTEELVTGVGSVVYHTKPTYATVTSVVTIQPNGAATYLLNFGGYLSNGIVFTTGSSGSTITSGTGLIRIIGKKHEGAVNGDHSYYSRNPFVWASEEVTNITINGLRLEANVPSPHQSAQVGIRCSSHEQCIITNNSVFGIWNTCIYVDFVMQGNCSASGVMISGNTCTMGYGGPAGDSFATGIMVQDAGCVVGEPTENVVIANNYIDYGTTPTSVTSTRTFYVRETTAPVWIFNNRSKGGGNDNRGALYMQDDSVGGPPNTLENYHIFNNTFVGGGDSIFSGNAGRNGWPTCIGSSVGDPKGVKIVGNIFTGSSPVAHLEDSCSSSSGTNSYHLRSTNDRFDMNYCYHTTTPNCVTDVSSYPVGEKDNIQTTVVPGVSGSPFTTAGDLHLQSTGNARGRCPNDPDGLSGVVCSVMAAGLTIDCTLDFEGTQRPLNGAAWDCGADQYVGVAKLPGFRGVKMHGVGYK